MASRGGDKYEADELEPGDVFMIGFGGAFRADTPEHGPGGRVYRNEEGRGEGWSTYSAS
jgi:hypothetical protein